MTWPQAADRIPSLISSLWCEGVERGAEISADVNLRTCSDARGTTWNIPSQSFCPPRTVFLFDWDRSGATRRVASWQADTTGARLLSSRRAGRPGSPPSEFPPARARQGDREHSARILAQQSTALSSPDWTFRTRQSPSYSRTGDIGPEHTGLTVCPPSLRGCV